MRSILWAIAGLAVLFIGATSARATLIASDSFIVASLAPGSYAQRELSGQTGTYGTSGYFTGVAGGNPAPGWNPGTPGYRFENDSLTSTLVVNPPLQSVGLLYAPGDGLAGLQYRDFSNTTPPASPTYFFSVVMTEQGFNGHPATAYIGLGPSRPSALSGTAPTTGFDVGYLNGMPTLFYNNGGAALATETLLSSTQNLTCFVEVAVSGSGAATTLTPKVYSSNGALLNNPPSQAVTATLSPSDMGAFQVFQSADFNNGSPAQIGYDELRFGTAESDVIVPEPAALTLIGVGLVLLRRPINRRARRVGAT